MLTTWVLIILATGQGRVPAVTTQEFNSQIKCVEALKVVETFGDFRLGSSVRGKCVEK